MLFWARKRERQTDRRWPTAGATVFGEGKAVGGDDVVLGKRDRQTNGGQWLGRWCLERERRLGVMVLFWARER